MISCSFKENYGIDCLTCGFQRSFLMLFEGDFVGSIKMFPATIPVCLTFLFCAYHLFFKVKNGHKLIVGLFSISSILIVGNFIFKLASHSLHG